MQEAPHEGTAADLGPGVTIGGRFRVEAELGHGGMSRVLRALDVHTGAHVAIKVLRTEIADDLQALARMEREAEILGRLSHPSIVGVKAVGSLGGGRMFLAMELLEGETLGARLRRGTADPRELVPIVTGAAAGLEAAHRAGIVHRDLKPDNLFLCAVRGSSPQVKLLDFGVSKLLGADGLTRTGQVLGTPRYMAPEQLAAEHDCDARVDVYALGVILYEALAGHIPFAAISPSDLLIAVLHGKTTPLRSYRPDLPVAVEEVVARAMARTPEARYASALELSQAFAAAASPDVRAPAGPAAGVRTSALGAMDPERLGAPDALASTPTRMGSPEDGGLRPGTFTALASPPRGLAPAPAAASPLASPPSFASPPSPASSSAAVEALASAPSERALGARVLLFVLPLLAGALSAGGALVVLRSLDSTPPAASAPGASAPAVVEAPAPVPAPVPAPAPAPASAPAPAPAVAVAVAPTLAPAPAIAPASDESHAERRHARRREAEAAASSAEPAPPPPAATPPAPASAPPGPEATAGELMQAARDARRVGDAEGCVDLLDRAIYAGAPVVALRLRGDCELRAGRSDAAVRSYERFCSLAPDHPAIGEVRAIVDGLGGRCP